MSLTPYADFTRNAARVHAGCRGVVAAFAKVPNDAKLGYRAGTIYYGPDRDEWTRGDRGVRCFLWVDRDVKRSMRNAGPTALPVR
ncbi:septum formation family protein [Actinomycetes bacterium KLBMP 9797]